MFNDGSVPLALLIRNNLNDWMVIAPKESLRDEGVQRPKQSYFLNKIDSLKNDSQ